MDAGERDTGRFDPADPDAEWRPGGDTLLDDRLDDRLRDERVRAADSIRDGVVNPWSRQASEQPTPSDDVLRARWRRELGLDEPRTRTVGLGATTVATPAARDVPPSSEVGDVVLAAVLVALALAVAAFGVVMLRPGGQRGPATGIDALRLAPTADLLWSVDLETPLFDVVVSDEVIVVWSPTEIAAFDAHQGVELWRKESDVVFSRDVVVFDDIVVVLEVATAAQAAARGFDPMTGAQRWATDGDGRTYSVIPGIDGKPIALVAVERDGPLRVQTIDPATGVEIGDRHTLNMIDTPHGVLAAGSGGRVELFDAATGVPVGPMVASFELAALVPLWSGVSGESVEGFADGQVDVEVDGLVGYELDGDIIAIDATGTVTDQRPFVSEAFGDFAGRAGLVGPVPGTDVVIVSSGSSIGVEVVDGRLEVRWEVQGRVGAPVVTERGPLSVARLVQDGTGEINMAIVDPLTGDTVSLTDEGLTREQDPVIGDVGIIVAPPAGAGEREVEARTFDGDLLWRVPLPNLAQFKLADGLVVVIDRSAQPSVAVYG